MKRITKAELQAERDALAGQVRQLSEWLIEARRDSRNAMREGVQREMTLRYLMQQIDALRGRVSDLENR